MAMQISRSESVPRKVPFNLPYSPFPCVDDARPRVSFGACNVPDVELCSYEDIVVDWFTAEAVSPTIGHMYKGISKTLLGKIKHKARLNAESFTSDEIAEMERLLRRVRGSLIALYGIEPTSLYGRIFITPSLLRTFNVMKPFIGNWPNFGVYANREFSSDDDKAMRSAIEDMIRHLQLNREPAGSLIAVTPAKGPPILIEGYKRALFALRTRKARIKVLLCAPVLPTAKLNVSGESFAFPTCPAA